MRTEFEAYLNQTDYGYILYLDEFNFDEMLYSIGHKNIQRILVKDLNTNFAVEVYNGEGIVPNKKEILESQNSTFDYANIIVNDIEFEFIYWDDGMFETDWETVIKIIEGQKQVVTPFQAKILENLQNNLGTYYFVKNDVIISQKKISVEELNNLLTYEFQRKEEEMLLGVVNKKELREFLNENQI